MATVYLMRDGLEIASGQCCAPKRAGDIRAWWKKVVEVRGIAGLVDSAVVYRGRCGDIGWHADYPYIVWIWHGEASVDAVVWKLVVDRSRKMLAM